MAPVGQLDRLGGMVEALIIKAETQGYLTTDDLYEVYPWQEEQLPRIKRALRNQGIEIVGEADHPEDHEDEEEDDFRAYSFELLPALNLEQIATDDTIGLYLNEMSRVPLLSLEQEVDLARWIEQAGLARKELLKLNGGGSIERRGKLEAQVRAGEEAREHLIKANTRLVVSIAKRYMGCSVPLLDLIQEGNLGLMKAVEKFDHRRGFRFSTYATWWIRQTITRAIADQGRTIRVPVHMIDRIRQLYRASYDLEQQLGRSPTTEELAAELDLDSSKVQWMQRVSWTPLSLESPVGDEEDSELGMFVRDEHTPSPSQAVYQAMLRERVKEVLATLSPREARILRLRFGLDEDRPYTLEEVGQKFGLTRERIRQIEGKALRRLRHPQQARLLRDYL